MGQPQPRDIMLYRRFEQLIDIFRDAPERGRRPTSSASTLLPAPGLAELSALLVVGLFAR
jgi:hypothetical protein